MPYANGDKYAPLALEWGQALTDFVPSWNRFAMPFRVAFWPKSKYL